MPGPYAPAETTVEPEMTTSPTLAPFDPVDAAQVSTWARTADEVGAWCSRAQAPVPAEVIAGWGEQADVTAFALSGGDDLVGYGELWVDHDEREVELARLIVDPARRNQGLGRSLVALLAQRARLVYPSVALRVRPDNSAALRCYAAAGFVRASPAEATEWNRGQPTEYVWMMSTSG